VGRCLVYMLRVHVWHIPICCDVIVCSLHETCIYHVGLGVEIRICLFKACSQLMLGAF
jgi:hypothetical protein